MGNDPHGHPYDSRVVSVNAEVYFNRYRVVFVPVSILSLAEEEDCGHAMAWPSTLCGTVERGRGSEQGR